MDLNRRFTTLNLVSDINPTQKQKELLDLVLLECSKAYNEALALLDKEYAILDSSRQVDPLDFMLKVMKRSQPDIIDELYVCVASTVYALSSDYSVYLDGLTDIWHHSMTKKPEYQDIKKSAHFCISHQRCDIRDNMMFIKFLEEPIELLSFEKGKQRPSDKITLIKIEVDASGKYKAIVGYEITDKQIYDFMVNHYNLDV